MGGLTICLVAQLKPKSPAEAQIDVDVRAPRGRELSVRSIGPEAGRRNGRVTGWVGALRRRRPWAAERSDGP